MACQSPGTRCRWRHLLKIYVDWLNIRNWKVLKNNKSSFNEMVGHSGHIDFILYIFLNISDSVCICKCGNKWTCVSCPGVLDIRNDAITLHNVETPSPKKFKTQ